MGEAEVQFNTGSWRDWRFLPMADNWSAWTGEKAKKEHQHGERGNGDALWKEAVRRERKEFNPSEILAHEARRRIHRAMHRRTKMLCRYRRKRSRRARLNMSEDRLAFLIGSE